MITSLHPPHTVALSSGRIAIAPVEGGLSAVAQTLRRPSTDAFALQMLLRASVIEQ